jgi:hypothetical protein
MANASYQLALAYARERVQGPKTIDRRPDATRVPIIEHPDVRRNLMLCKAYSEGARALLTRAGFCAELAQSHPDEAVRTLNHDLLELLTPVCKAYATDIGFRVAELAVQIHGGYGYIKEFGVEQMLRDVKIASIYEGTNGVQALDLLGRKMRIKGGALFMTWLQDTSTALDAHKPRVAVGDLANAVDTAKNALADVAMSFVAQGQADPELVLLSATPFLEMFGHVEVGRLLVDQAAIADQRLGELCQAKGVPAAGRAAFVRENEQARFYDGKLKTARFFVSSILPHAFALAETIKGGDRSALDMAF